MADLNILPSPDYKINIQTGEVTKYTVGDNMAFERLGPGFSSVKLSSNFNTASDRTNSGQYLARTIAYHKWSIDIGYNSLTREQLEPIYTFLMARRGGLKPFFVSLPQYSAPKDPTFKTWSENNSIPVTDPHDERAVELSINMSGVSGTPLIGDTFTINDPSNSNHYKVYTVTYANSSTIGISPGLEKSVSNTATLNFNNPVFRVVADNIQEYSLNTNNLYSFSLKLEEALA